MPPARAFVHRSPLPALLAVSVAAAAAAAAAGCATQSYPMCGNGAVETGEQCDWGARNGMEGAACDRNCKSVNISNPQINASWTLLTKTGIAGYKGTNCEAVGAARARVQVEGPLRFEETLDCTRYGKLFTGACVTPDGGGAPDCSKRIMQGDYKITVTLLRNDDTPLTSPVTSTTKNVQAGVPVPITVDIGQGDFLTTFSGSLVLSLSWGADATTCAKGTPPVDKQSFRVNKKNAMNPITGMTLAGTPLDGTEAPCVTPMGALRIEEARDLDWGPYDLVIQGFAAGGMNPAYCGKYEIYIGPGRNNQQWNLLVPLAGQPDAGVCP